ncbi:hypothetical protein [Streptomyces sp. AcH 505]|uniref:hypothetical protein n=1 Tax=Streptomyces sp. AcH 505 TaxID=352211 RepID=UPI0012FF15E1
MPNTSVDVKRRRYCERGNHSFCSFENCEALRSSLPVFHPWAGIGGAVEWLAQYVPGELEPGPLCDLATSITFLARALDGDDVMPPWNESPRKRLTRQQGIDLLNRFTGRFVSGVEWLMRGNEEGPLIAIHARSAARWLGIED